MSMLIVNFNELSSLTSTAKSLSKKLGSRIDDYSDIKKKLGNISYGYNINQANYFIQKKNEKLQEKKDNIDAFIRRVSDFREEAKETDKRVAKRISSDTNTFRKVNNISVSFFSFMALGLEETARRWFGRDAVNLVKTVGRNIKYAIKDWYHDRGGKYYINIAKDIALLALAIVTVVVFPPAGALGIAFAAFSIINSMATIVYDFKALSEFKATNNRVIADRIDEMGGEEVAQHILGDKFGSIVYHGLSLGSIVYSFGKDMKGASKLYKNFKTIDGSFAYKAVTAYRESDFVKSAFDIKNGGDSILKLNKLNKVFKSFNISTESARNIANILGLYEDIDQVGDLVDYIDIFKNKGDGWEFKAPTTLGDTFESTSSLFSNIGALFTEKEQATRIPSIKKIESLKMPVMCTP